MLYCAFVYPTYSMESKFMETLIQVILIGLRSKLIKFFGFFKRDIGVLILLTCTNLTPHFISTYFISIRYCSFVHKFAHHSNRLPAIFASYFTQNNLSHHHDALQTFPGQSLSRTDVSRTIRFPDKSFRGQDISRTRLFPDKTFPGQDVSRTRPFPDNHFPGQTFPGQVILRNFIYSAVHDR